MHLASAGYDRSVRLWDTRTGKRMDSFERQERGIVDVAFALRNERIISASWERLQFWDATTGKILYQSGDAELVGEHIVLSPDEKLLAVAESSRTHSSADLMVANTLEAKGQWAFLPYFGLALAKTSGGDDAIALDDAIAIDATRTENSITSPPVCSRSCPRCRCRPRR
jgi:WD40 repeat protein